MNNKVLVIEYNTDPHEGFFVLGVATTLDIAKQMIQDYFEPDEFKVEKESDEHWIPNIYRVITNGELSLVSVSEYFIDRI